MKNETMSTKQCCERDHNHDGNCDIHSAPGVLSKPTMSTKHTPTKWEAHQTPSGQYVVRDDNRHIAWIDYWETPECLDQISEAKQKEIAELLASAPALLAERDRLREALTAISNIAGNLSDDALDAIGGVNDGRDRAIKLIAARQIARAALNR